ncbi:MAG: biotin/lipoyl-binding protein, partial [Candidatus Peribacteraceae bacterium]|nr:biotin/lipoyl-binding protein [Candidatus Peribacteraceae bacterium]
MPNWRSLPSALWQRSLGFVKRHYILSPILGVVALLFILLLWAIFKPAAPEYITAVVTRGDLVQRVEAVGTITSDRDLNLKFPTTGIIAEVFVKEGDKVTAGQELAKLRNDALAADVASAAAQLASAQANLRELQEGTRPEDITIAQADVANKRAQLEAARTTLAGAQEKRKVSEQKLETLKQEASINLASDIESAASNYTKYLTTADNALKSLNDVFVGDPVVRYYVEFFSQSAYLAFRASWTRAQGEMDQLLGNMSSFADYQQAVAAIRDARPAVADVADVMNQAYNLIAGLPVTDSFSIANREEHKTTISTGRTNAQTALSGLDTSISTLQTSTASYDTLIATEEATLTTAINTEKSATADIATYEATLRSQEAQLALKIAGPRTTTIAASRASVNSAYASLSRARAKLEDSIIRAPADGTINKVDFKLGEFTGDPDNIDHSITILGTSPFRMEMILSEVDI